MKQILEGVYNDQDEKIVTVYEKLLTQAGKDLIPSADSRLDYENNAIRAEARAYVALVTYVLEQNGENIGNLNGITGPDLPSTHDAALDDLRQALRDQELGNVVFFIPPNPEIAGNLGVTDDAVKWTATLTHLARTVDLYLALENAYQHYGDSSAPLLDQSEKSTLLSNFASAINGLDDLGNQDVIIDGTGVSYDEVRAGNWPMKVHVAVGYAALMQQDISSSFPYQHWVRRALRSAGGPTDQNRSYHWHYQTSNVNDSGARRFWAEGPFYLHFSLREIIPFWHGMRINDMLGYHPDFNVSDPLNNSWFTTPLHWMADLSTPDGRVPPLDDGKKRSMNNSSVLRWTNAYGDGTLGQKFAWINERAGGVASSRHLLTVELAIPREGGDGAAPESSVGNASASETGVDGEQQIILRRNAGGNACDQPDGSGDCHYIAMNGESGDAYGRGEGHEQADQLQLLYYVDGTSFLMDSGYDNASGTSNSTWNHYYDHNVLHGIGGSGGLPNPVLSIPKKRMVMEVNNPGYLYRTQHGNVDVLRGKQHLPEAIVLQDGTQAAANYKRDVLFVDGSDPYLIDFSRVKHWASWTNFANQDRQFKLSYHVNSNSLDLNGFNPYDGGEFITWSDVGDSGKMVRMYPLALEYKVKVRQSNSDIVDKTDTAKEEGGPAINIERADIKNFDVNTHPQHFSVATIVQAKSPSYQNAPKLLWNNPSQNHRGWVWQQDAETYDVFIGRESKTSAGSAVRVNLQNADNQYPDYRVELPSGKRYGFARVHKSGGEWKIDSNYQVNLELAPPPPLDVSITSGPAVLDEGEQGTWTASASKGGASYTWSADGGSGWYQIGTGSSVTWGKDLISETITVDIKVEASKDGETASAQTSVIINNNDGGGGCNAPRGDRICLAVGGNPFLLRDVQAEAQRNGTVLVNWQTSGSDVPTKFVVQHRADSTGAWSTLGTVPAGDSSSVESSRAVAYRFETDDLEIGTHQFRVGLSQDAASAPRAVGTTEADNARRYAGPVTAEIAMEEAYRLSTYPNPVQQQATVELAVKERQDVQVRLYDVLGRRVGTLHDGPLPAQELRRLRLDAPATGLTSGTYFLRVTGEEFAATEQITVVR